MGAQQQAAAVSLLNTQPPKPLSSKFEPETLKPTASVKTLGRSSSREARPMGQYGPKAGTSQQQFPPQKSNFKIQLMHKYQQNGAASKSNYTTSQHVKVKD